MRNQSLLKPILAGMANLIISVWRVQVMKREAIECIS